MNVLLLFGYNNYLSRIYKKESSVDDYYDTDHLEFSSINFNPGDGISTELIIGGPQSQQLDDLEALGYSSPDYLVC